MTYSLTQFQNSSSNPLAALDNNVVTLSGAAPIACTVAGTNTLTLTQNGVGLVPSSTLAVYTKQQLFTGIASATNTASVKATIGTLGALNVYKDTPSGPTLLSGGEIIINNAFSLLYDPALNSGLGGFHLTTSTAISSAAITPSAIQINGGATLTNRLSGNSPTLTFTVTPGWSSQDVTFTLTGLPPAVPAPGDFIQVVPPSIAATGVGYQAMVTALGSLSSVASVATIAVRLINSASASLASNSGVYRYLATRAVP